MYIELKNVTKEIKKKRVLSNVSLQLEKGKAYGFIGHNGSGKSMLFRAICGFIRLNSGSVVINGQEVKMNKALPVAIGLILETPGFISHFSGIENLNYLASIKGQTSEETLEKLLTKIGLLEVKDKKVKSYSLGMRQKLAIIQAVMEDQELIILDEPTNGLDKDSVKQFKEMMLELKAENKTILIASHNEQHLVDIVDETFEMNGGSLKKLERGRWYD